MAGPPTKDVTVQPAYVALAEGVAVTEGLTEPVTVGVAEGEEPGDAEGDALGA